LNVRHRCRSAQLIIIFVSPRMAKKGFNRSSPKASCDPVGPSLVAGRTDEPGAKSALMPQGTSRRAPSIAAAAAFREKQPQYRCASSCTARVGAAPSRRKKASLPWPLMFRVVANPNIPPKVSDILPIAPKVVKKTHQWW